MYDFVVFEDRSQVGCEVAKILYGVEMRYRRRIKQEDDPFRITISGQIALEVQRERFTHSGQCLVCLAAERQAETKEAA